MIRYLDVNHDCFKPGVVCLGFFDGVHLGHRAIIREGKTQAEKLNVPLYIHTYDIPPLSLIKQGRVIKEISPLDEKASMLMRAGADIVAVSRFDDILMHMSGEDFFLKVLLGQLKAKHLVIGSDHRFGYKGKTKAEDLKNLCRVNDIGLSIVPAVRLNNGKQISSTAIREALSAGDIESAEMMLGWQISETQMKRFRYSNDKSEKLEEYCE